MTPFLNFFRPLFVHSVGGVFPRCARGRECTPHSICGFMHPPLLFLSAKEKEERRARCRRKRGPFAFGLHSNPDRCRASFRKALLLLRAPPESRCGRETMCFYPSAPKWAEPFCFRKGNAFGKKSCLVTKSISSFSVSVLVRLSNAYILLFPLPLREQNDICCTN